MTKWSCGHTANATCGECYQELAKAAHLLATENLELREREHREVPALPDLIDFVRILEDDTGALPEWFWQWRARLLEAVATGGRAPAPAEPKPPALTPLGGMRT
jgi:hypothetical protein